MKFLAQGQAECGDKIIPLGPISSVPCQDVSIVPLKASRHGQ